MGKGSGRRPLLISEQEAADNWNKIFRQSIEKRFLDGISKPNEEQFNGNVTNTSSTSKDEEGKLPSSTGSGNI